MDNSSCSNWISTVIYRQLSTSVPRKTKGLLKDDAITGGYNQKHLWRCI
jgi:hypothetical protein